MAQKSAGKHAGGRPSDYSIDTASIICARLTDGESLRSICNDEGMPDKATVFRWLAKHQEFRDQYAIAREGQADALFDEIIDIADDGSNDWMERKNADGQNIGWTENGEALRRSALRVDARKWIVSKLLPKKYGERITQEHVGANGGPIQTASKLDLDSLIPDERDALREILSRRVGKPTGGAD